MSRPCDPGVRPAVTSWFLLALTALAALLGSGLEIGGPVGTGARAVAAAGDGAPEQSDAATDAATDARVPFVGAVLGSAAPAAGTPLESAVGGTLAAVAAPLGLLEQAPVEAAAPSYVVVGGSGRAPPVTSGT